MTTDAQLLSRFTDDRSEKAFAELLARHIDLVHSAAMRHLSGDATLAQDVTQAVFTELAKQAKALRSHPSISGWLYTTARHLSLRLSKSEGRRTAREIAFMELKPVSTDAENLWNELKAVLDSAMDELSAEDREAVILRYFQEAQLSSVGATLGISENTARMRVTRALEKLRVILERKGIRCSSTLLGATLAAHAVTLSPGSLAASIIGPVLASAAASSPVILPILGLMTSTKLKVALAGAAIAALGTGYVVTSLNARLRDTEAALQVTRSEIQQPKPSVAPARRTPAEDQSAQEEHLELMRLRGEVTRLRAQARAAALPGPEPAQRPGPPLTPEQLEEINKTVGLAKLNFTKTWGFAFLRYAQENEGKFPDHFPDAAAFLPELPPEMQWISGLTGASDFELVFRGNLNDLQNPAATIVLREKTPFNIQPTGEASRTYLFGDGHTEIHTARDGNFEAWERARWPLDYTPESRANAR